MTAGGHRAGSGRHASHLHSVPTSPHTVYGYRSLFGLEKKDFRTGEFLPRNPAVFLTVACIHFFVTRTIMATKPAKAVDWDSVELHLGGAADKKDAYTKMVRAFGLARNGMKRLNVSKRAREQMPFDCHQYIGTHCTGADIMFCSQIHLIKPTPDDPLRASTVQWLQQFTDGQHALHLWHTMTCFGKLRQASSVRLLIESSPEYIGFKVISTPETLGAFIAAQDDIVWRQMMTLELSKLPGPNSHRAGVALAGEYGRLRQDMLAQMSEATTYKQLVDYFKSHPGNRNFVAKNIVEVILNAVNLVDTAEAASFGEWLVPVLRDYMDDPEVALGPGPDALGIFFFGGEFSVADFERVRAEFNELCQAATVSYLGAEFPVGALTGPQMGTMWCKIVSFMRNYVNGTLGQHYRKRKPAGAPAGAPPGEPPLQRRRITCKTADCPPA